MKQILFFLLISLTLINCSKSNDVEKEYFPDFNRVTQFKLHKIESNIRYYFDDNNNYESFGTGKYFFEVYNINDSIVIDDYRGFSPIRRAMKFNSNDITIYTYDNNMSYIEGKSVYHFNERKTFTFIEEFAVLPWYSNDFFENQKTVLSHDSNGNLINMESHQNTNYQDYNNTIWKHHRNFLNFDYLEHPIPNYNIYAFAGLLPPELSTILYNKGYRLSSSGVKRFTLQNMSPNSIQEIESYKIVPNFTNTFDVETKHFYENNTANSYFDYFISFTALID